MFGGRIRLLRTPLGWALSLAAAGIGAYLLIRHTGHVLGAVPFLILLACPLMHLLGHHGHHHSSRNGDPQKGPTSNVPSDR